MMTFKRIVSLICVTAMLFSMCAVAVFAANPLTCDETVAANWTPLAAKYSKSTYEIIAPRNNDYQIRTTGFDYKADENGGIKVHSATYKENAGIYSVAAIASKNKTLLDGLTIELKPDDMTMLCDSNNASTNVSFIISENPITEVAGYDEIEQRYTTGLYESIMVAYDGLRELTCAEGKSLVVTISNRKITSTDAFAATTVSIVYDDGSYVNKIDGRNGFEWVFSARNFVAGDMKDYSGIKQPYENIDFSEGLKLEVRADDRLGYIVTINNKDYYDATCIAYYPDCSQATFEGKEYNCYYIQDEDYKDLTKKYTDSMTYAAKDIDLSGLGADFKGYLTIGATGTNVTTNNCDFTVTEINNISASTWKGEASCEHFGSECLGIVAPTCRSNGYSLYNCDYCNVAFKDDFVAINPLSHSGILEGYAESTCTNEGFTGNLVCEYCDETLKQGEVIPVKDHVLTYFEAKSPTCTEKGWSEYQECANCNTFGKVEIPALGHNVEIDEAIAPTCTKTGLSEGSHCTVCGEIFVQQEILPAFHSYVEDILQSPTCTETGIVLYVCHCGDYYIETLPVKTHSYTNYEYNYEYQCIPPKTMVSYCDYGCGVFDIKTVEGGTASVNHSFTDYTYNDDASCTSDGTMTANCDYGCGTVDTMTVPGTMLPHTYNSEVVTSANCKETGEMKYTCSMCGNSYTEVIPTTAHNYLSDVIKTPTCQNTGMTLYMCSCGDYYIETTPKIDHSWSEWTETKAPTESEAGEKQRSCSVCGTCETKEVAVLLKPEITVDNYVVKVTNAACIKDMRYALGEYTTTTEIRNAEGNVALSNAIVVKNTIDGCFVYEMPNGGMYSIWIRMQDGRNYILPLDVTNFTPSVTTNGVTVTLYNLYDVKDFYIAKGELSTYREIKDNGYLFSATSSKLAGKHNYTCTVKEPGVHTILIRYNDGTQSLFHEELTVDEPVFTTNGLQVTVSNIPNVKVIRTAYGEYYTPGDTKRAEGARNFSNKSVIKGTESYKIQYREEGRVTIVVEYNNGYIKVFHYDVVKKVPNVTQNMGTVTFGNLDGLVMIRYAEGEYISSAEIKKVPGSKVIKSDAIVNGRITIDGLEYGKNYTFSVQYNDESYCIRKITVTQSKYTLVFNVGDGAAIVNSAPLSYGIDIGDKYFDVITEFPIAKREGYVFKGWWNRTYRIALAPDFDADKVFELFFKDGVTLDNISGTIELVPIWDVEGDKTCTLTFTNPWVDDFEPIVYECNVGDFYIAIMCGEFPDPKVIWLDDWNKFSGWYIEELNYLLTESDMWELGYPALDGDWVFEALYFEQ